MAEAKTGDSARPPEEELSASHMPLVIAIAAVLLGFFLGWGTTSGKKTQYVRLGDILIFGPILIYAGFQVKSRLLAIVLIIIGASTMAYNYKNYLAEEARTEEAAETASSR